MSYGMRKKIEHWMNEEDIGIIAHLFLLLCSLLYACAVKLRLFLYDSGVLKKRKLPCRVISIGNITAGGTGKTPIAMHIAKLLKDAGAKPLILSRGYKRKGGGIGVVSDGKKILLDAEEAGDEPYLIAKRLAGVPVVVCSDRYKGGVYAWEKFKPDVIILDDGFQHIRLARDLNILLVDASRGFGNGYMLPRGILREPLSRLDKADIALVKGSKLPERDLAVLRGHMVDPLYFSYRPSMFLDIKDSTALKPGDFREKRALLVSGIANPESFARTVDALGLTVGKKLYFPDHHDYTRRDIDMIRKASADCELIVTTEKDAVKLSKYAGHLNRPVFALSVEVQFSEPERLTTLLLPFVRRVR